MARTLNAPKFTGRGPLPESGNPFNSPFPPAPATEKQINFLIKLCAERGVNLTVITNMPEFDASKISKREASQMIEKLLNQPRVIKPASGSSDKITEAGMYQDPASGKIYKVQKAVHGSGHLYAKVWITDDEEPYFEMARGMVYKIKPEWKMSHEEAAKFGSLYGVCCSCAKPLTDENSITAEEIRAAFRSLR